MTDADKIKNLRSALAECLERIHDYFGLSNDQMQEALDAAEAGGEWSPYGIGRLGSTDARWRS